MRRRGAKTQFNRAKRCRNTEAKANDRSDTSVTCFFQHLFKEHFVVNRT